MTTPDRDLSEAARELWALLHNGRRPEGYQDAESERYYRQVVESFLASPVVLAVARALIGEPQPDDAVTIDRDGSP